MQSVEETTLPNNVLSRILESLYIDFLLSDETRTGITEHQCSLLHPCVIISKSASFQPIHAFRLTSSKWNKVFLTTASLLRYTSHQIVQVHAPPIKDTRIYKLLRKAVIFGRYRVFHILDTEHSDRGVFVAYDFGVPGGCKKPREVIIKAWIYNYHEDYLIEKEVYGILSASPMKGYPSLIETPDNGMIYALVLEKLGPSFEELCNLMPRFDEKMTLAMAIQMLDRYASLHARNIIHNGVKPGNICLSSLSSNPKDSSTLHLIDFGCSFPFGDKLLLDHGAEFSGNKRFWSALSFHTFTQSQRDDLESLGYLLSALYQGSLPWDDLPWESSWRTKMSTPGSELFRGMDPSFLEYWKDVRSLAFGEIPDYCSLKSRFEQCWERKGFGGSPGEYDWFEFYTRLVGAGEEKSAPLNNPLGVPSLSAATSVMAPDPISNPSHSTH